MFPTITERNNLVTGVLAGAIALTLVLGVIAAVANSGGEDKPSPAEEQARQEQAQRQREQGAAREAQLRAEADQKALATIQGQQEACRTKYIPEATQRANVARQQLKELEASLNQIVGQLPPGKAKDLLTAQIPPDVASAMELINAEQRSIETRCKMAFTIYQYTRETTPPS